jgi:hypothetical protein
VERTSPRLRTPRFMEKPCWSRPPIHSPWIPIRTQTNLLPMPCMLGIAALSELTKNSLSQVHKQTRGPGLSKPKIQINKKVVEKWKLCFEVGGGHWVGPNYCNKSLLVQHTQSIHILKKFTEIWSTPLIITMQSSQNMEYSSYWILTIQARRKRCSVQADQDAVATHSKIHLVHTHPNEAVHITQAISTWWSNSRDQSLLKKVVHITHCITLKLLWEIQAITSKEEKGDSSQKKKKMQARVKSITHKYGCKSKNKDSIPTPFEVTSPAYMYGRRHHRTDPQYWSRGDVVSSSLCSS